MFSTADCLIAIEFKACSAEGFSLDKLKSFRGNFNQRRLVLMIDIAILNYGIGNLKSLERSIKRTGATPVVTDDPTVVMNAPRLLLPGVGHFQACMESFENSGLRSTVEAHVKANKPLLGICVGMQMLFEHSEEGDMKGLGWIKGRVKRFPSTFNNEKLRVPHVGMSTLSSQKGLLFDDVAADSRFYFTHSYRIVGVKDTEAAAYCEYGGVFTAAVQKGHIYGTQFHPEKSHSSGIALLKSFIERG